MIQCGHLENSAVKGINLINETWLLTTCSMDEMEGSVSSQLSAWLYADLWDSCIKQDLCKIFTPSSR